jgi:hypothetical protein
MRSSSGRPASADVMGRAMNDRGDQQPPLGSVVFLPKTVEAMGEAFDRAWTAMLGAGISCALGHLAAETRRQLALAIIVSARRGVRDRDRLRQDALGSLFPLGVDGKVDGPEDARPEGVLVDRHPPGESVERYAPSIHGRMRGVREWADGSGLREDCWLRAETKAQPVPPTPPGERH